ncbi:MFS transporter [Pantoea sp. 18069]|uniref:MFS transporter n=1 Tax=Pantoea sp. 18069 TaxID=2681415 RepID=UPI001356D971|nr:MFS transporter [Pantoea sp. 18069]
MSPGAPSMASSALLGVAQIVIWGGSFFLLTVLAAPIHVDTGWSLTGVYGALTVGALVSGLLSPWASRRIARGRGRHMLVLSSWLVAAGLVVLALAPHYSVFVAGWAVIGLGMAGGLYDPLFAVLGARWGQQARGAIYVVTLIGGFASTITWPALAWLEPALGWRTTCLVYAAFMAVVMTPLYLLALPPDAAPAQATAPGPGTDRQALADVDPRLMRLLSLVFCIAAILMTAVSLQIILLLQGTGHSMTAAIALSALIGPSMVGVRVLNLAFRNLHAIWMALFSAAFVALGMLLISTASAAAAPAAAALGIVCYGVGNGLRALVRGTLPLALVPAHAYALVMGRLARSSLVCQALTPLVCGFILSQWGARSTLWLLAALAVANTGLSLRLQWYLRQQRAGGLHASART